MINVTLTYVPNTNFNLMMRSSFLFAAVTMLFGPFLVLTPTKQITLKKDTFFKKMVVGAQKDETRYFAFGLFCFITLLQGFVVFSLWTVLSTLVELRLVLGIVIGYSLVCLFYLVIFYSVMMKKPVIIKGINLMEQIRRNIVFTRKDGSKMDILGHKHYVKIYVALFTLALLAALVSLILVFVNDLGMFYDTLDDLGKVILVGFFIVNMLCIVVFSLFILNVAFNPVSLSDVVLDDGTVLSTSMIRLCAIGKNDGMLMGANDGGVGGLLTVNKVRSSDRVLLAKNGSVFDPDRTSMESSIQEKASTAPIDDGFHAKYLMKKKRDGWEGKLFQDNDPQW
eukprot:TRINITY_DN1710_c1_g1_i1.p1 TRINITY_DN1710_c1_g1~~TRINITY_DN1710_c1_g1_i1.p1  ORF type:complete len:338 (-),score=113.78 TRINITY_DN1710_c1_g1_i1:1764-2777(-)